MELRQLSIKLEIRKKHKQTQEGQVNRNIGTYKRKNEVKQLTRNKK